MKGEVGRACVRAEKQSGLRGDGPDRPTEAQLWQGLGGLRIQGPTGGWSPEDSVPCVAVHLPQDSHMTGVTHQQWHLTSSLTLLIVTALEWPSGRSCPVTPTIPPAACCPPVDGL